MYPEMKDVCSVTPAEMKSAGDWVSAHIGGAQPPFSFIYGGQSSVDLFKTWKFEQTSRVLDDKRTELVVTYTDPGTGLSVRSVAIEYHDFPVVEWTLYFKNTGSSDTPILENIQALDLQIVREDLEKNFTSQNSKDEILLHYNIGSPTTKEDYRPMVAELAPGEVKTIATSGGRSCNAHMPFFNLEWSSGGGLIIAIGWGGQWAAKFDRDKKGSLQVSAGQELTHFKLYPGEEVRSPLIALQFYKGDWIRAQNVWRRWIIAHNMPKPGGLLPGPQIAGTAWLYFAPWGISNALAMKVLMDHYEDKKIAIDAWWIDAGWYICNFPETGPATNCAPGDPAGTGTGPGDPDWSNTGTWEADPYRFPKGIREVSRHAHGKGLKTILWFQPELVMPGTYLAEKHPEWLLVPPPNPGDQFYNENKRLLNLGNPDARQWLINHVDEFLTREGIDVYREDFNMDPLYFWRANDPENRQGITEIQHVTGHLAFWDELRRRHPNLLIDNCSSGCKRADLETMRRSVILWRSDYLGDFVPDQPRLDDNQCITYGIASWIPYFGTGSNVINQYRFYSHMSPSYVIDLDPRRGDMDLELLRRLIQQFKQVAKYFFGDYYPLTGYSLESDVWMAWQFDCPEIGEGMVQVFRRENSPCETVRFPLRGLAAKEQYAVTNLDGGAEIQHLSGQALMEDGLFVEITKKPWAAIITYRCESKVLKATE